MNIINNLINKLRSYLNKDVGIIVNLDGCLLENTGKMVILKIPFKSFEKYGLNIINESETTRHVLKNETTLIGKSQLELSKKGGFIIKEIEKFKQ